MEPQLAPIRDRIVGALYYPGDECGDAYAFCRALIQVFLNAGGKLRTGRRVLEIITRGNVLSGLQTDQGFIACRQAVIAAGNGSGQLLGRVNVSLPIRPAKGYSLTVETPGDPADRPRIGVVDDAMHAAVVPLGSRLRIVGTAEFAGNDRTLRAERVENLMQLFRRFIRGSRLRSILVQCDLGPGSGR